ncbi:MAG TPA: TIGR02594 family protein [Rhizomicrobium sp.]|jgi:uncharacterized protein (TIGR02594 family)
MTDIPIQYQWLQKSVTDNGGHPKMVAEALANWGVHEIAGPENNPVIMGWVTEIGALPHKQSVKIYTSDDKQAWCGLFMSHLAHASGYAFPDEPLWALNWAEFGDASPKSSLGDVLVFNRFDAHGTLIGGHVGLYVAEDDQAFHVLGGNESNQVEITRIVKARLKAARRPPYAIGAPANVTPNIVQTGGQLSANEQ